ALDVEKYRLLTRIDAAWVGKTLTLKRRMRRDLEQIGQSGKDIQVRHRRIGNAGLESPREMHEQRHPCLGVVQRPAMGDQTMLVKQLTVIAGQHHDGAIELMGLDQGVIQAPNRLIYVVERIVVLVEHLLEVRFGIAQVSEGLW